jgi:hypothetical protein
MNYICKNCGYQGDSRRISKSSFGTEVSLWIIIFLLVAFTSMWLLILPLGFTIWRAGSTFNGCDLCKSASIIPLESPAGKKLAETNTLNNAENKDE